MNNTKQNPRKPTTETLYRASSATRSSLISILALIPLSLVAGCGIDGDQDPETASEAQSVTGECVILRPYGWSSRTNTCGESFANTTTLHLPPGRSTTFVSSPLPGLGTGRVTVVCHSNGDGRWDEVDKICRSGGGGGGLP